MKNFLQRLGAIALIALSLTGYSGAQAATVVPAPKTLILYDAPSGTEFFSMIAYAKPSFSNSVPDGAS